MFSNTSLSLLQLSLLHDASVFAQSTETREAGPAATQYISVQGGYIPTVPSPLPATFSQPYAIFSTAIVSPSGSGYAFGSSPPCFAYCQMDASQNILPTCGSLVASQCACDPAVVSALQKCLQANCEAAQLPDAESCCCREIVSSGAQSVSVASAEASEVLPPTLAETPSQSAQTSSTPVSDSASASPTASASDSVADPNQLNPTSSPDTAHGNAARGLHADAPALVAVLLAGLSMKALAEVLLAEVLL